MVAGRDLAPSVLVLGVAYKKDIDDLRESPALDIIRLLEQQGAKVAYHDPWVPEFQEDGHHFRSTPLSQESVAGADCVIIVTDHSNLDYELIRRHGGGLTATFTSDLPIAAAQGLPGVREVRREGTRLAISGDPEALLYLGQLLVPRGGVPADFTVRPGTLEDAYIRHVGPGHGSVPAGGDLYMMKKIIHDWDDARCITLLRNCAKRMEGDGRVYCVDAVLPPMGDTSGAPAKFLDMNMLVNIPGKERTESQWRELFGAAGLRLTSMTPLHDNFGTSIVEGRKG